MGAASTAATRQDIHRLCGVDVIERTARC